MNQIEQNYNVACSQYSDINEHIPTLRLYSSICQSVCEFGVRTGVSTWGFLQGLLDSGNKGLKYIGVDIQPCEQVNDVKLLCEQVNIDYNFIQADSAKVEIPEVDILFIDSWHVYGHLKRELKNSHQKVKKFIIMHDTTVDEFIGESIRMGFAVDKQSQETGYSRDEIIRGLWPAVEEFLNENKEWTLKERFINNNGLTILERL